MDTARIEYGAKFGEVRQYDCKCVDPGQKTDHTFVEQTGTYRIIVGWQCLRCNHNFVEVHRYRPAAENATRR